MNAKKKTLEEIYESMVKNEPSDKQKLEDFFYIVSNRENIEAVFLDRFLEKFNKIDEKKIKVELGVSNDTYSTSDEIHYKTIEYFLFNLKNLLLIEEYRIAVESRGYYDEIIAIITVGEEIKRLQKYLKDTRIKLKERVIFSLSKPKKSNFIILNGTYIISRVDFDGANEKMFEYLLSKDRTEFTPKELKDIDGSNRAIAKRLNDLGFSGELKKLFFPSVGKKGIIFAKTVTEKEFKTRDINSADLKGQIFKLDKLNSPV
jgi:hypothetical protein